jgi:selenocysteine lyase/cysteine desulfurase
MDEVERRLLARSELLFELISKHPRLELQTDTSRGRYAGIVRFSHRQMLPSALHKHLMDHGVLCAQRAGGVRFSPHFYTPEEKIVAAVKLAGAAL